MNTRLVSWTDLYGPDPDDGDDLPDCAFDERPWSFDIENAIAFDDTDTWMAA